MSSQGVTSSKETYYNAGFCPVKGQISGLDSWTMVRNHLSSLSLGTDKIFPHYHILAIYPVAYLFSLCSSWRPARPAQVQQNGEKYRLLRACRAVSFPRTPACPGTQKAPQDAGWKCHSTYFGTVSPMETLF
jgi:hypothetical protein